MEIPSGTYMALSVTCCYSAFQYSFSILKLEQKISGESNEVRRTVKEFGVHNQNIQNMHKICWGGGGKARQMQQHDSTDKTFKRILQTTL